MDYKSAGLTQSQDGWHFDCPTCGKQRTYSSEFTAKRAIRNNQHCTSCSNRKREQENNGAYSKSLSFTFSKKDKHVERRLKHAWTMGVKERDGCCQVCFSEEKLHAHHIFGKSYAPSLRHSLNNGITLCEPCHREFHQLNGYTQIQFAIK